MSNTIDYFSAQKDRAIEILAKLSRFMDQGLELGVPIHPTLLTKIEKSLKELQHDKLRIALIGGFSEGKTSIAAAWLERMDDASMKISQQESSNEVRVYEIEDKLTLIDTPGLYGFKEQVNSDTREVEKYKDITKNYVSEAHIVLYVMNPTNPIKESHKEDLQWLFRTLNLLPRTVFVLGRFDEVADVEEESDYAEKYLIKKQSIIQRLDDTLHLTPEEKTSLSIVAVAANPFGMGSLHWLKNIEEFRRLSHIGLLQEATQAKIQSCGGAMVLANEVKRSIISDIIEKQLPVAKSNFEELQKEASQLERLHGSQYLEINKISRRIQESRISLRGNIIRYFEDLIRQVRSTSMDAFGDFHHREIGSEGILINQRVQEFFADEVECITLDIGRIQVKVDSEISHFTKIITAMGKEGINYVASSKLINNNSVLAARNGINAAAKTIGLDIGKYLKFKPWGATKLANGLSGAIAVLGLALEAWDSWKEAQKHAKFQEAITLMASNLDKQRSEIVTLIDSDDFVVTFFPGFGPLQVQLEDINTELSQLAKKQHGFRAWYQDGMTIDTEFRELNPVSAGIGPRPAAATPQNDARPKVVRASSTDGETHKGEYSEESSTKPVDRNFWQKLFS
jgi:GTP-binding protein EngB required for normal cell division